MNTTGRRYVRVGAAIATAVSLIGLQSALSNATASTTTTTTWMPSAAPALWSDRNCATDNSAPTYTPGTAPSDALSLHDTQTYVPDAGSHSTGPADVAWSYAPTSGGQVGPAVTIPASTTAMSVDVLGATSGRLMVVYNTTSNNQPVNYVGVWDFATTAGWHTVSTSSLTWYQWQPAGVFNSAGWIPANNQLVGLQTENVPLTFAAFFKNMTGTAQAAFEVGCTGAFSFDHVRVTDSSTNVADYDAQTPASTTNVTQGASRIGYGTTTTITPSTSSGTTTNPAGLETLLSSTDGGDTWTPVTTAAPGDPITVSPSRTTSYKVLYASATPLNPQPSTSNELTVSVSPKAALSASSSKVNVNRPETFTLHLTPAASGVPVTFQQASGTSWATLGTATTNSSGVATLIKSHAGTGAWKVRAVVASHTGYVAVTSNAVTVGVYQPVSISIARTASTVLVGRSFRVYGVVTPHWSGIALQLQQYVSGRWVVVATGHPTSTGSYSFTKVARYVGTASFRVVAPASGYRLRGGSSVTRVTIVRPYTPPPPPPPSGGGSGSGGGGGGGGSGIG